MHQPFLQKHGRIQIVLRDFLEKEASGGIVLMVLAVLALLIGEWRLASY